MTLAFNVFREQEHARWRARRGMFSTEDRMDRSRRDPILTANHRTSMCDYRLALALALGKPCDRNGYTR